MSRIVQKKNAPLEELAGKVSELEAKLAKADSLMAEKDQEIERLNAL